MTQPCCSDGLEIATRPDGPALNPGKLTQCGSSCASLRLQ
jgi:hypothetical protein